MLPEGLRYTKGGQAPKSILYGRQEKASRNRYSGIGFKLPLDAVIKSNGVERKRKGKGLRD